MKIVVCYSGGHSSALVAIEAVRQYGKQNVILLNHDISSKVEHKDIKRFKRDVADYLDIDITYANAPDYENNTPIEVSLRKQAFQIGNGQTFCTHYLKTEPFQKWLKENCPASFDKPNEEIKILYGFDKGEISRIQRRSSILGANGYKNDYPLAYWKRTIESTREIGILPPVTYKIFKHANCIGCLKGGKQHWYCVYCMRSDIWYEARRAENKIGYSIVKGHFLEEWEKEFCEMKYVDGICPNDKMNHNTFWAKVRNAFPGEFSYLPCDCSF